MDTRPNDPMSASGKESLEDSAAESKETLTSRERKRSSASSPVSSSPRWALLLPLAVLALFAANLFLIEPLLNRAVNPRMAQLFYIGIRILGFIALAYALVRYAKRNRFQTLSTVLLVGFIDQALLKGLWVKRDIALNPEAWQGFSPTNAAIFVNMATGYLFFVPVILILAFLGMESTRFSRDWNRPKEEGSVKLM